MSHTVMMLLAGIALLIVLRLALRDPDRTTRWFLPLWLAVSVGNLLVGVLYAGYSWSVEAGVGLVVFGVPAAVALLAARFLR